MSGPYQGRDLSNCGVGRLPVAINCGVLSVNNKLIITTTYYNITIDTVCSQRLINKNIK